jgi:hypothetical protein
MDIDIDLKTLFNPINIFTNAVPASMVKNDELVKHPCGHYLQNMPVDVVTGLAAIPYNKAESEGYFKIDFLHLSLLDNFSSKREMRELLKLPTPWDLLLDEGVVVKLFQLSKHHNLIQQVQPKSVDDLADCVALIRPNKRQLLTEYLGNRSKNRHLLYRQDSDTKSSFKRSHAIAYALTIILQLHLVNLNRL